MFCCMCKPFEFDSKLLMLSLEWPGTLDPRKTAQLSESEIAMLQDFSCAEARCFLPRDRAYVLNAIREQWGSEAAFDNFVRTRLLSCMEKSKRRYQGRVRDVVSRSFEMLFGT